MRSLLSFLGPALCIAALGCQASAAADALYLEDGSKLVGTLGTWADDQVTISTAFADALAVPADAVEGITTDAPRVIALHSGERISGRLVYEQGEQHIVDTLFGDVRIGVPAILGVWRPDEPSPVRETAAEKQTAELEAQHQQEVAELKKAHDQEVAALKENTISIDNLWSGTVELGLNGETGNTEQVDVRLRTEALRETETDRLKLSLSGHYGEDDGEKTNNEIIGGARLEVDITKRLFTFGKLEIEFDEFEDLDLRATVSGGLGYFFLRKEHHEFKGRAGVGFLHETFSPEGPDDPAGLNAFTVLNRFITADEFQDIFRERLAGGEDTFDSTSENEAIIEFGYDYRIDFDNGLRLTHTLTYFPTFTDPLGDYRLVGDAAVEMPLGKEDNWHVRLGARDEYDSQPQPGIDRNDISYFLNFGYDWE